VGRSSGAAPATGGGPWSRRLGAGQPGGPILPPARWVNPAHGRPGHCKQQLEARRPVERGHPARPTVPTGSSRLRLVLRRAIFPSGSLSGLRLALAHQPPQRGAP